MKKEEMIRIMFQSKRLWTLENSQNLNIGRNILESIYPSLKNFKPRPLLSKLKFHSYFLQEEISSS